MVTSPGGTAADALYELEKAVSEPSWKSGLRCLPEDKLFKRP